MQVFGEIAKSCLWGWYWRQPPWVSQSEAHTAKCFRGFSLIWRNQIFKTRSTLKSRSKQQIWDLIDPVIKSQSIWAICLPAFLAVLVILQKLLNLLFSSQQIVDRGKDVSGLSITLQEEEKELPPLFELLQPSHSGHLEKRIIIKQKTERFGIFCWLRQKMTLILPGSWLSHTGMSSGYHL